MASVIQTKTNVFTPSKSIQNPNSCDECGGQLIQNRHELTCRDCGLIKNDFMLNSAPIFYNQTKKHKISYEINKKDVFTQIGTSIERRKCQRGDTYNRINKLDKIIKISTDPIPYFNKLFECLNISLNLNPVQAKRVKSLYFKQTGKKIIRMAKAIKLTVKEFYLPFTGKMIEHVIRENWGREGKGPGIIKKACQQVNIKYRDLYKTHLTKFKSIINDQFPEVRFAKIPNLRKYLTSHKPSMAAAITLCLFLPIHTKPFRVYRMAKIFGVADRGLYGTLKKFNVRENSQIQRKKGEIFNLGVNKEKKGAETKK